MIQTQLSIEAFQGLSEFILVEILENPVTWTRLSKKFLELHSLENDNQFRWLFSRLISKMLNEHWIAKTSDQDLFEVGITFNGRTVLRHKSEISALYDRHFKGEIEKANRESKAKKKKQRDRVKEEQEAIKKSEKLNKCKTRSNIGPQKRLRFAVVAE